MSDDLERVDGIIDRHILSLLAELEPADLEPAVVPSDIWARITDALAEETPTDEPSVTGGGDTAPSADLGGTVVTIDDARRRRPTTGWLTACAACVALAVGYFAVGTTDERVVVATAELRHETGTFDPAGINSSATVRLERDGDVVSVVVDSAVLPDPVADDLELWLIEVDEVGEIVDMSSISVIDGSGSFVVPASVDTSTHRVVDISVEPRDGDPTHSGRSILRGTFTDV